MSHRQADEHWEQFKRSVIEDAQSLPGWCTPARAALLMDTIVDHSLRTCVEVGVFGGSSCVPIAEALRYQGHGVVHAVDAWQLDVALAAFVPNGPDWQWWSALDLDSVHAEFCALIDRRALQLHCRVVRMESHDAAARFADGTIDFVHFDGAHHDAQFLDDIQCFWPKIRDGGYILVNDAHWHCMQRGLVFLGERTRVAVQPADAPYRLLIKDGERECRTAQVTATAALVADMDSRPTTSGVYWWRPHTGVNFGDELSKVIVERLAGVRLSWSPPSLSARRSLLFALGSILNLARDGDVVWGSGFRDAPSPEQRSLMAAVDVRAVRGPMTRDLLLSMGIDCPAVYGDPALLLPRLYPDLPAPPRTRDYVVIPNCGEIEFFHGYHHVVSPMGPWRDITRAIRESALVVSSSLHGLVVADAYGIPARWLRMTNREPLFKYQDYYAATGRPQAVFAASVGEALDMGGEAPARIDLEPLVRSFPGLPA